MSNHKLHSKEDVLIDRDHWDVPMIVELPAYLHFSRQIDAQLRRLVVSWSYSAAPIARGKARSSAQIHTRPPRS
jgi:hypothetical protein